MDATYEGGSAAVVVGEQEVRLARIDDAIGELAAHIHAATFRLLQLIREYEEAGGPQDLFAGARPPQAEPARRSGSLR